MLCFDIEESDNDNRQLSEVISLFAIKSKGVV